MILQISDINNNQILSLRDLNAFTCKKRINDEGSMDFSIFHNSNGISGIEIKKGYKIDVLYVYDYNKYANLFSGYIEEISPDNEGITITSKDRVEYMKHRFFRIQKTYNQGSITNDVINDLFSYINSIIPLPFSLGLNDCILSLSKQVVIERGTSLFDAINQIVSVVDGLQFRIEKKGNISYLDVSLNTGKLISGIWKSNIYSQNTNTITYWKRKTSISDDPTMTIDNNGVINEYLSSDMLPYEKYIYDGTGSTTLSDGVKLPTIGIDVSEENRWDIFPGDTKNVNIVTGSEWMNISYVAIVQGVTITADTGSLSVSIDVGDKIGSQKNVLDKTLSYFSKMINVLSKK